mmetsp:Transcript_31595/g.104718  ORF Transcript_31595/g.104718 Transcript_31595/m.104718 type:complete len:179 (-) Transcript_31595:146-682(-)
MACYQVASRAHPRDGPAFAPHWNSLSVECQLDAFAARASGEAPAAQVSWDCKLGPSIFNDEILAPPEFANQMGTSSSGAYDERNDDSRAIHRFRPFCRAFQVEQARDEECPICLELLQNGQVAWRLPCMHQIHDACAAAYFSRRRSRPSCPLCRCDVRDASPPKHSTTRSSSAGELLA